jgi:uncharacterized protein (UPF0335 family)
VKPELKAKVEGARRFQVPYYQDTLEALVAEIERLETEKSVVNNYYITNNHVAAPDSTVREDLNIMRLMIPGD